MTKNILDLNCGFLGYYYIYHQQHYQISNMFFQFSKKKVCCPISMVITYTTILEICIQDKLFLSLVYEFYNFFQFWLSTKYYIVLIKPIKSPPFLFFSAHYLTLLFCLLVSVQGERQQVAFWPFGRSLNVHERRQLCYPACGLIALAGQQQATM